MRENVNTLLLLLILVIIVAFVFYVRDVWTTVERAGHRAVKSVRQLFPKLVHHECITIKYPNDVPSDLLTGIPGDQFNMGIASLLGKCIISAYNISCGYDARFPPYVELVSKISSTGYLLRLRPNIYIMVFRGTLDGEDIIADIDIAQVPFVGTSTEQKNILVHRGFYGIWNSMRDRIRAVLTSFGPDDVIYITGHSLGAALAAYTAVELSSEINVICYLYGVPRCGNEEFIKYIDTHVSHCWNIANRCDTIPFMPPTACNNYVYADFTNVLFLEIETGSFIDNHGIITYVYALANDGDAIPPRQILWNKPIKRLVDLDPDR